MLLTIRPDDRRFGIALALALGLHLAVLALHVASPSASRRRAGEGPLQVTMAPSRPAVPVAKVVERAPQTHSEQSKRLLTAPAAKAREPRKTFSVPGRAETAPTASTPIVATPAQDAEMGEFLDELAAKAKPATGSELAYRALAAARAAPTVEDDPAELRELASQNRRLQQVDRFSLEMYFDALYQKLNRTAAMVKRGNAGMGRRAAAVSVTLNQDGTLKSFRVLWSADQQAEIAYVNALFERAAPFSPFPPDMRRATQGLILRVCILPGRDGGAEGAMFTPMAPGSACGGG